MIVEMLRALMALVFIWIAYRGIQSSKWSFGRVMLCLVVVMILAGEALTSLLLATEHPNHIWSSREIPWAVLIALAISAYNTPRWLGETE